MGVNILNKLYSLTIYGLLHRIMHFSTDVGSEIWFCVNSLANSTHLSTAEFYFVMIFSELCIVVRVRRGLTHFFCGTVEKSGINDCL